MNITDEDMVPMELLDEVLAAYRHKIQSKFVMWKELVEQAKAEIAKLIRQHGVETEKAKKLVESSVYINYMIQRLDDRHKSSFKLLYIHEQLYRVFVRQPVTFKSSYDFENLYEGCDFWKRGTGQAVYSDEYTNTLNKEMQKFNGKISVGEDATTGSDMTSQTGISRSKPGRSLKSSMKQGSALVT